MKQAMDRLFEGRTVIVISHRLSTIINADEIVFIEDGRVVDSGDHAHLYAKNSQYRKLYDEQFAARPFGVCT